MAKKSRNRANRQSGAQSNRAVASTPQTRAESRRAQRVVQQRQAKRKRIYTMFGGAAAAALVLALILVLINQDDSGAAADDPVQLPAAISEDIPHDGRVLGNPDAPVRIIEYGDYQCPACGQFARSMQPMLINDYVATGQVAIEYRDFAFLGQESLDAAEAAMCALDQDMFWPYHDTLYNNQVRENEGAFAKKRLISMAEELGMDVDAFKDCIDSDRYAADVAESTRLGQSEGVRATPTFFVNGTMLEGAPPYDTFRQHIDAAIQAAS